MARSRSRQNLNPCPCETLTCCTLVGVAGERPEWLAGADPVKKLQRRTVQGEAKVNKIVLPKVRERGVAILSFPTSKAGVLFLLTCFFCLDSRSSRRTQRSPGSEQLLRRSRCVLFDPKAELIPNTTKQRQNVPSRSLCGRFMKHLTFILRSSALGSHPLRVSLPREKIRPSTCFAGGARGRGMDTSGGRRVARSRRGWKREFGQGQSAGIR